MTSDSIPSQTFAYIEHMLIELRQMSEKQNAPVLAYLIEMAIIEAKDVAQTSASKAGNPDEKVKGFKQLLSS